jgi:iron complex transport system substrate-binding protein
MKGFIYWLRFGIAIFCSLTLTIACYQGDSIRVSQTTNSSCRNVEHAAGITCIPQNFTRLVAIDDASFENAIALGIKPVGSILSDFSSYLQEQFIGVENIGKAGEPNLESILAIKPDLILGIDYLQSIYSRISKIAPTVLFKFEHSGLWKNVFEQMSEVLDKKEVGQQVMDKYYSRLNSFKQKIKNFSIKVSVIRVYPDNINLYLRDSFCGTILQDAGLSRPQSQDFSASEAEKLFGNSIQTSIGNELIEQADGDVIFIWTAENTSQGNQTAKNKLEQLTSSQLWQNLKAVQENKVYLVPDYWIGSGMLAANAIIDDLFKYLVK